MAFAAGHLTRRYDCEGELRWINVLPEYRGAGIASELLRLLADWFLKQDARKICVDVEPSNTGARAFYLRHGARPLRDGWLVRDGMSSLRGANSRPNDHETMDFSK